MSGSDKELSAKISRANNNEGKKTQPLAKHMRRRYWSSWEEMKLVEMWHRHNADMTNTVKHEPVFATISCGMKSTGFNVNSQECRRKIHQFKNKYMAEQLKIEHDIDYESDWKLYPLIDSFLNPGHKSNDVYHEQNIVNNLLLKMPALPPSERRSRSTLIFDAARNGVGIVKLGTSCFPPRKQSSTKAKPEICASQQSADNPYKRIYNSAAATNVSREPHRSLSKVQRNTRSSNTGTDFRLGSISLPSLVALREDIYRLEKSRDLAKRRLIMQEQQMNLLETMMNGL